MLQKQNKETQIRENFKWLDSNRQILIDKYPDKVGYFVIIRDKEIINFFQSYDAAISASSELYPDGMYSIQKLEKKSETNLGMVSLLI